MKGAQESWAMFCAGDNLALKSLFDELMLPLQYESYYYTKDWNQSMDIIGDLFLMLLESNLEKRQSWRTKNDCISFLKVVVKYKSIDWVRMHANHQRLHQIIDWPVFEQEKISAEDLKDYALSLLNPKEQKFLREIISGITVEELAAEADVSEKTIRNNLSIIRLKLSKLRNLIMLILP
jgi:RNA polymerase sigma factor (sigma-70 family)